MEWTLRTNFDLVSMFLKLKEQNILQGLQIVCDGLLVESLLALGKLHQQELDWVPPAQYQPEPLALQPMRKVQERSISLISQSITKREHLCDLSLQLNRGVIGRDSLPYWLTTKQ
jgi:hypothetical protein